jgi:putative glycosyltransferase
LGGLIIFCLGVIGIYLAKMFLEIKQRPYTVIRKIYDREARGHNGSRNTERFLSAGWNNGHGTARE